MTGNPPRDSSKVDSKEDFHDRWFFNLVVFFALLPFTVLLSYVIGSFIGIGFGVALVGWRVAVTREITNPITSRVHGRSRQFLQNLFIGLAAGFTFLGVTDFVTLITGWNARAGSPLSYSQPGTVCDPGGCLMAYDPVYTVLDYVFWVGIALVLVFIFRIARIRFVHYSNNYKRPVVPTS